MASLISQMRNGPQMQQRQPQLQLNESIQNTRAIMNQIKNSQNPQVALEQMLQSNPNVNAISNLLQGGNNLESIARQMAKVNGIDINQLIRQLTGI